MKDNVVELCASLNLTRPMSFPLCQQHIESDARQPQWGRWLADEGAVSKSLSGSAARIQYILQHIPAYSSIAR